MAASNKKPRAAIVRGMPHSFERCIVRAQNRPAIDCTKAREQLGAYIVTLKSLASEVHMVRIDHDQPDSVFVEDCAVVLRTVAISCMPGAPERRGEREPVAHMISKFRTIIKMEPPATLDGGDVLSAGQIIYVGASRRSNAAGIKVLSDAAAAEGKRVVVIEIPDGTLHLKSVMTAIDNETFIAMPGAVEDEKIKRKDIIYIDPSEPQGANVLAIAGSVIVSSAAPRLVETLGKKNMNVIPLDISEFEKADGGVTCLSVIIND
ncbi:MAG: hypothetical protein HY286_17950 [Planctomycetes bacterium]|nr:hypothetical protein [Planctomycetota bacterium]